MRYLSRKLKHNRRKLKLRPLWEKKFLNSSLFAMLRSLQWKKNVITLIVVIFKTSFESCLSKVTTVTILSSWPLQSQRKSDRAYIYLNYFKKSRFIQNKWKVLLPKYSFSIKHQFQSGYLSFKRQNCHIPVDLDVIVPALVRMPLVNYDCIKFHCNWSGLAYCMSAVSVGNKIILALRMADIGLSYKKTKNSHPNWNKPKKPCLLAIC